MMLPLKRFFISQKTVLTLIVLILATVITGYVIPQRFSTPSEALEKWQQAYPFWAAWAKRSGLDHVYSTPWFVLLLLFFLVSLVTSTYEQIRISIKKTFGTGIPKSPHPPFNKGGQGGIFRSKVPEQELISAIKKQGYFKIPGKSEAIRFVKHPWGYWGSVLFHLGIVVVIVSSLVIVLTEKRGLLHLVEGELYVPGSPWLSEEKGILSGSFILPEAVRIDSVTPEFWETDHLKQLTTVISFIDSQGRFKKQTLAINQTVNYRGLRIYQGQSLGDVFFVELTDKDGRRENIMLQIESPAKRNRPSYGNFQFAGIPYFIKAKYFADADKQSIISVNPLLVMRLVDGKKVIGETSLKIGERGELGPYRVRLLGVSKWVGIIFLDIIGMPGIFFGFFIIILGSGLTYFMPPREFYVKKEDNGIFLMWKASRFESFYGEEYEKVLSDLGCEKS